MLTALFFMYVNVGLTVCGKQVFAPRIANAFLMKYLTDKLQNKNK